MLTACDTEGTTAPDQPTLDAAVATLASRNELVRVFVADHAPVADARCVADGLVVDPQVEPLLNKQTLTDQEQALVRDRIAQGIRRCRAGCGDVARAGVEGGTVARYSSAPNTDSFVR